MFVYRTRPGELVSKVGSAGKKIALRANFFELSKRPDWTVYQYR
jgi:hypothetical protein